MGPKAAYITSIHDKMHIIIIIIICLEAAMAARGCDDK